MFERDFTQAIVDYNNFDVSQLGEAALFGGAMVLIGMVTIFAVLVLLWGCLALFKVIFHDLPEKKKSNKSADAEDVTLTAAPVKVNTANDEIVAVIAAAIAMAESENNGLKFRVVSFKRK